MKGREPLSKCFGADSEAENQYRAIVQIKIRAGNHFRNSAFRGGNGIFYGEFLGFFVILSRNFRDRAVGSHDYADSGVFGDNLIRPYFGGGFKGYGSKLLGAAL